VYRRGWLLDANIDQRCNAFRLWIKRHGQTRGYIYHGFRPALFVHSTEFPPDRLREIVGEHPQVECTEITERFLSVYDEEVAPVVLARTRPAALTSVARDLQRVPGATVFHADIDAVQQFFIERNLFPFGQVEFELSGAEVVDSIRSIDGREATRYSIPPLTTIRLNVFVRSNRLFPRPSDPIDHIEISHEGRTIRIERNSEQETLHDLQTVIDEIDPDVIVTNGGDEYLFHYLSIRARANGMDLVFSRDGTPLRIEEREASSFWQYNQVVFRPGNQVLLNGRIHIDEQQSLYYSPRGMEGIVEGCRLAMASPQRVARMSIGSVNAAVQFYHAFKRGLLIPPVKRNPEFLKTLTTLAAIDRGGLIFQPRPGVYENVVECDFSSMYPTLMVNKNISPETICFQDPDGCEYDTKFCLEVPELPYRICQRREGIVPEALRLILRKRSEFKRLIKEGHEANKYHLMKNTLKGILVSCFGYLGFRNARFGRVEAHAAVTAFARELLLRTREIGEERELEVVHGIVDSIWFVSREEPDYERVQEFCRRVTTETGIDMSLKGIYRWLVIPSSRVHPTIAPLNRYYGVYRNGAIKIRGLAARRRDTCLYVGDCQMAMIKTLASARNKREYLERVPQAYDVCRRFIQRLYRGDVDVRDLILYAKLTRDPREYRVATRASIVADQLMKVGRRVHAGQRVAYVIVDSDARIPEQRVRAVELMDEDSRYDPEAYARLCLRTFEELVPTGYCHIEPARIGSRQSVTA